MQQIDVNEMIIGLERLNPTSRPTRRFPSTLATLSEMDIVIKDGNAKITANMNLLNTIESKIIVSTKLSVEGPLRMKEEYVEGVFVSPKLIEETLPEQLRGALSQAASTVQQLFVPIRDAVASGFTIIPFSGTFKRLFMISYLDEEILIIRDTSGLPEVLTRLDAPLYPASAPVEYET